MRKLALWLAFLLTCGLALPALAQDDDEFEDDEEEEVGAWGEYGAEVSNRYQIGLTSFATFLADPVLSTMEPDDEFDELPLASVTKYPVGFGQGLMLMTYRCYMGILDLLFAPLTPMRMLSPEPRIVLFENAEHDEY